MCTSAAASRHVVQETTLFHVVSGIFSVGSIAAMMLVKLAMKLVAVVPEGDTGGGLQGGQ